MGKAIQTAHAENNPNDNMVHNPNNGLPTFVEPPTTTDKIIKMAD